MRILSIDIGIKNCGIAIIEIELPNKITKLILKNIVIFTQIGKKEIIDIKIFFEKLNDLIDHKPDKMVVERQNNLNNKALQIYHYLECFAFFNKIDFIHHSPITRYIKIHNSNRLKRKNFSLELFNTVLKNIKFDSKHEINITHDIADALNIGLFFILRSQNKKLTIEDLKNYFLVPNIISINTIELSTNALVGVTVS